MTTMNGARADALARLSDEDRNIIILYRRGGAEALVSEGYARSFDLAEELFGRVRDKIATQRVPAESQDVVTDEEDDGAPFDPEDEHEDFPRDEWPHTEGHIRPQVVEDEDSDQAGKIKRQRLGRRAFGPSLRDVDGEPSDAPGEETPGSKDPTRSPILEWLERHGAGSAPQIAEHLNRKSGNVSTRLSQLERGGFVRRTGRTISGGRGGPQIEWELCDPDKPPTGPEDTLESPLSPVRGMADLRARYFDALIQKVEAPDCPEHILDRIERLIGIASETNVQQEVASA